VSGMRWKKDEGKQEIITGKAVFARPNRTKKEAACNSAFGTFGARQNRNAPREPVCSFLL